jgi:hypothetical protein
MKREGTFVLHVEDLIIVLDVKEDILIKKVIGKSKQGPLITRLWSVKKLASMQLHLDSISTKHSSVKVWNSIFLDQVNMSKQTKDQDLARLISLVTSTWSMQ